MRFPSGVTRFPNGVSSNDPNDPILANLPVTAPQYFYMDFNDFTQSPASWDTADTSGAWPYLTNISGAAITDITNSNEPNGCISMLVGADDTAIAAFAGRNRAFEFTAGGNPIWFEALFYLQTPSDLNNCEVFVGISNSFGDPPPSDDGVYFVMNAGGELVIECHHDGDLEFDEVIGQVELGVEQKVGFYFDGSGLIWAYQGQQVGSMTIPADELPLGPLGIWSGIRNVAVDSNFARLDYYMVAQDRVPI